MSNSKEICLDILDRCHQGGIDTVKEYDKLELCVGGLDFNFDDDFFGKVSQLAENNNSYAFVLLGSYYEKKGYCEWDKAFACYEQAASFNNSIAFYKLAGMCIIYPRSIKDSDKRLIYYYEKAIELGNHHAMFDLAEKYFEGYWFMTNYEKVISLCERAVGLGNTKAMCLLALVYKEGFSVLVDYEKAFGLYEKAAGLGNIQARHDLIDMYEYGLGVKKDMYKALEMCVELGHEIKYGLLLARIINSNSFDIKKIVRIYDKSYVIEYWGIVYAGIKNVQRVIDFFNRRMMRMILVRKNIPGDMVSEILGKI